MNWKRALVASTLTVGLAATSTAWATTQDAAPAQAPPAKASTPVQKKKPAAKKPQAANAKAANAKAAKGAVKTGTAVTCEPTRTFVPVQEQNGVCTPATPPADGQKFNTLEDIYIPPPEPEKKK